jgi:hypothetical protein
MIWRLWLMPAAAALAQYLPVVESGDEVYDACPDVAVYPVVVVADDRAGVVASRCGDGVDAAVAAVAEDHQHTNLQGSALGPSWCSRHPLLGQGADGMGLAIAEPGEGTRFGVSVRQRVVVGG